MEPSSDNEQQQLEEDIRQLDEALLDDNDGELFGSDLEGSRQSEDEAEPVHSIYDDEPEDITQQPSTSHASNLVDDFAHEGSNQEDADSEDDEEAEPSIQQLLVLNRRYQEFIVSNLRKVQDALEKNRLMQAELLDNKKRDREIFSGPSKLTPPYFRDKNFLSPPSNEEAVAISKKGYPMPVNPIYPKIWSKLELKSLKEGVKADGLEKMMCPLLNHREVLEGKFKKAQEQRDKQSKRALVKEISDIDVKLSELKVMPEQKILGEPKRDVDWHKVSSRYLEGKRTVAECQLKWQNYTHPLVRHEWTDEDDRQLKKIARVHNAKDWNIIASELGRGFTAFECLQRYQQRLNDDLYKRPYTEAEDQLLAQLVEKFRIGNHIPWIKVAYFLNDRKAKQCSHRWQSKLDPSIRNGKWSDWEDQILLGAVKKYKGRDWTKVAFGIPGRCGQQCRNRWVNVLNPGLRKGRFSAAEDVILLESVKQCGLGHWSSVQTLAQKSSDFLPGRTTPMIMSRYRYLSLQQADKLKKEFKEKQTQHKKACIEQSMTSLVGDTQTALLDEMEETFEDYCNKFTKDELLDGMIASAKKRVTELGEKARWTNVGIASGVHYEVNKEQAGKWKKNQKALALAAQAANDFKDVKVSAPRTNTRHRRSENVLTYDPKKKKIPISQQNVLLDQQLIKAVFPSRTLMPNKFFEKKGRTTTRLSRSEYISSELNKKKPLTWGTAVLVLLKASRVDLHLCKGIIHRSARLPNINIIADKTDNLPEAPKYRPLATTPGGKLNNRPLTMMLNKSNAPEMISGEVIGQLSGTSESITSAKKQSNTIPGATLSAVKQNDLPVDKQSNPMYVVKTCDKRILLVSPGTSQATGSSSRGGSVSQYVGGRAGSIHGVTGSSNLSMANQRSRPPAMTQSGIDEVGDYATIVPTVPKRINSDADKGKAVKTSKCSYTVRTDGPSVTVPVVTSTTAVAGQSSGQQTQLFHKPLLLSTSSVASQGTAQNSLLQLSNSLLHQNQVGCNPGGVISNIQLINGTPSNVAHLVTSPLRVPPTGKSVTLSVSPISASSLSSVMTPSTTSGGIYQHAQSPTVAGLNTLAGTNQSLVKRNLGTSEVASTNGQGSTHLCDTAPLHNSGSGMIFSPQVLKKHKGRKRAWPQNPTVNPKIVIGVTKNPGDEPSSVKVPTLPKRMNNGADKGKAVKTSKSSSTVRTDEPSVTVPVVTSPTAVASQSSMSKSGQKYGEAGSAVNDENENYTKDASGPTLPLNKPCTDGVHCGADDEDSIMGGEGNLQKKAKMTQGVVIESGNKGSKPCSDGVHYGTDDEEDSITREEGSLQKKAKTTQGFVAESGNKGSKPCSDGVHCGTDDEEDGTTGGEGSPQKKAKMTQDFVTESGNKGSKPCSDGVHCGTDDEEDSVSVGDGNLTKKTKMTQGFVAESGNKGSKPCSDGVHCGTDDKEDGTTGGEGSPQKKAKLTQDFVTESGNKGSKPCSDGVHCGTDDEEDGTTGGEGSPQKKAKLTWDVVTESKNKGSKPCSDGVHCGTDDEEDSVSVGDGNLTKKTEMTQGFVAESGNKGSKPCSDGVHCGTNDEEDGTTGGEGSLLKKAKMTQGSVIESGNKGSKPCSDHVHCGTDDEEDGTTGGEGSPQKKAKMTQDVVTESKNKGSKPCSDGVHCGTDDEEDGTTGGEGSLLKKAKMTQGSVIESGNKGSKPCSDGVHCGTDDEEDGTTGGEGSPQKKAKLTQDVVTESKNKGSKPCSDGVHCGTDDEEDSVSVGDGNLTKKTKMTQGFVAESGNKGSKPCSDGVHCGTNDEEDGTTGGEGSLLKKAKMTQGSVIESGNKGSKPCSDGVHCGTDDEEDGTTGGEGSPQKKAKMTQDVVTESKNKGSKPCSDGVHCGTDDEEDGTTGGEGSLLKKAKMTQGFFAESGNKGSKPCSDGVHCGTDDEEDSVTVGEGNLTKKAKMAQGSVIESGNKGSKPCSDGVHCGTDDEEDSVTVGEGNLTKKAKMTQGSVIESGNKGSKPCSDGVHRGTDDEEDSVMVGEGNLTKKAKMTQGSVIESGNKGIKPCSDGVHCGTHDEDDNKGSRAGGTKNSKQTENSLRIEGGDGSCSRIVAPSNKDGEVTTIQCGDVPMTQASANPGSGGGTNSGSGGDPAPIAMELGISAKRPKRKAAPKPGSFVMSTSEDDEDSDRENRRRSSKAKKLKSGRLDVTNRSPSVLKSSQVPTSQLFTNLSQLLAPSPILPVGGSTTTSVLNLGQTQLPLLGRTTPIIASKPTILVGPGGVILGLLPGTSPVLQLPQIPSVLNPTINTLPNIAVQQPLMNNAVISNLLQQQNVLLQQPLGTTVNPKLITLPNLTVQPPVSGTTNMVTLPSVSSPALRLPGGTSINANVTVPSNQLQNTMKGSSGMIGAKQSPVIVSLTSAASPVAQSYAATTVPNLFPLSSSIIVPTSQSGGVIQHVIPQGQTSVNHVSNFTNVVTSTGPVNSLPGMGNVIAPTQVSSAIPSGVVKLSPLSAVPSGSVVPKKSAGLTVKNMLPPRSLFTTSEMPSGGLDIPPPATKKNLRKGKKSSTNSISGILKEIEKMKPNKKSKCVMLPHIMKDDQYTVDFDKLEEFSKSILGTSEINFEKEMPMLPPNLVTLFSFKHLLIKKISLEDKASEFSMTLGELQDLKNGTVSTKKATWLENIADEEIPITRQQFLKEMRENPMYSLFKERFTMLFLWPAFLSLLAPFPSRKKRTVVCQPKTQQKLQKEKESQAEGKKVSSEENNEISNITELDKSVDGKGGETVRRGRGRPRVERKVGDKSDAKKTNNSGSTRKKRTVRKVTSPQLPTRRGTRATPLRKNVKKSATKEVAAVSNRREEEESPGKTS